MNARERALFYHRQATASFEKLMTPGLKADRKLKEKKLFTDFMNDLEDLIKIRVPEKD